MTTQPGHRARRCTGHPVGALTIAPPTTRFHNNALQRYAECLQVAVDMTEQRLRTTS